MRRDLLAPLARLLRCCALPRDVTSLRLVALLGRRRAASLGACCALVVALDRGRAPLACDRVPTGEPPIDARREGALRRAVLDGTLAAVRGALISHPESVFDTDRRGRTALHLASDAGQPAFAI